MPEVLRQLLSSRKWWLAVLALSQSIIFGLWPNFPPAIWQNIDLLLGVLIVTYCVNDAAREVGSTSMAAKLEIARIESAAVVSAASVTAKPSLANVELVAEVPTTLTEKAAKEATK
jgi:hypothetical protein